jgi:hypothetical protein
MLRVLLVVILNLPMVNAQNSKATFFGDSVPFSFGLSKRDSIIYLAQLQSMLEEGFLVLIFVYNCATLLKKRHDPCHDFGPYQRDR